MQRSKRLVVLARSAEMHSTESDEDFMSSGSEYLPSDNSLQRSSVSSLSSNPNYSSSFEKVRDQILIYTPEPEESQLESEKINSVELTEKEELPLEDEVLEANSETLTTEKKFQIMFEKTENEELTEHSIDRTETPHNNMRQKQSKAKVHAVRIRRKHFCLYCYCEVGNYSRHLERHHADEIKVQEFMALEKNNKERKKLIDRLRREGDFSTSQVIPVISSVSEHNSSQNYIVCKFCSGYYSKKSLRRHAKKCFFNPDSSKRFNAQVEGQTKMAGPFGPHDILKTSGLLNMLRADNISLVAKKDPIICEVARRYIKSHKEKHLLIVAKRYMRRLARLLISVRNFLNNDTLQLIEILTPNKFKALVKATQSVAKYDNLNRVFESPSLALQMGTHIKLAINTAFSLEVQKQSPCSTRMEKLKALTTLIETDWAHEISSEASQNLAINKFNKPTLIPLAKDIKKFQIYLNNLITTARHSLIENASDSSAFRKLVEGIFCSVLIFNKRRVGELQRMTLLAYMKNSDSMASSEFEKVLTDSEKILYKSLKRVVVRGKRGRGVPVLFDKNTVEAIELLISVRNNFNLENNPYIFGLPGSDNPITGNAVIRKHAKFALGSSDKASLLTSTRLRKHLATITQIFKMNKSELEQLATFMGHTSKTHSEFYRLPDDVYQTAKISKLLLLSKEAGIEKYKGKSLEEIEIDDEVIEDNVSDDDDNEGEISECEDANESTSMETVPLATEALKPKKGSKRTLVPWTVKQKKIAEDFFKTHLKKKQPPKKHEIMILIEKYPQIFKNKTWPVIKVYICNKFKK